MVGAMVSTGPRREPTGKSTCLPLDSRASAAGSSRRAVMRTGLRASSSRLSNSSWTMVSESRISASPTSLSIGSGARRPGFTGPEARPRMGRLRLGSGMVLRRGSSGTVLRNGSSAEPAHREGTGNSWRVGGRGRGGQLAFRDPRSHRSALQRDARFRLRIAGR